MFREIITKFENRKQRKMVNLFQDKTVISVIIMILFANPLSNFVAKHPTIQMLGLSFLILIGFMLIAEAAHMSHTEIFGQKVGVIPKGYLYFTIAFSLALEFVNMKMRKKAVK